jgi:hypothetical protein
MGATTARQVDHAFHQVMGALRPFVFNYGFERIEPFLGFHYIGIVGGLRQDLVELG